MGHRHCRAQRRCSTAHRAAPQPQPAMLQHSELFAQDSATSAPGLATSAPGLATSARDSATLQQRQSKLALQRCLCAPRIRVRPAASRARMDEARMSHSHRMKNEEPPSFCKAARADEQANDNHDQHARVHRRHLRARTPRHTHAQAHTRAGPTARMHAQTRGPAPAPRRSTHAHMQTASLQARTRVRTHTDMSSWKTSEPMAITSRQLSRAKSSRSSEKSWYLPVAHRARFFRALAKAFPLLLDTLCSTDPMHAGQIKQLQQALCFMCGR